MRLHLADDIGLKDRFVGDVMGVGHIKSVYSIIIFRKVVLSFEYRCGVNSA